MKVNELLILKLIRTLMLFFFCFALWSLLSKEINIWAIAGGIIFSMAATLFSYEVFYEKGIYHRSDFIIRFELFLVYLALFVLQSYIASFELIYRIITRKYDPCTVRIKTRLKSRMGKVFLANTISMIPGTLSLWMDGNHIYIHWFDAKSSHSIKAGSIIKQDFEKLLEKIFG